MSFEIVTDVSIDDLTTALSQFGTRGAAELGYFHALTHADSIPILFRITVSVAGAPEQPYGPSYARGTIDYSDQLLTAPPKLLGLLEGISADHTFHYNFLSVTATSVDYIVRQNAFGAGVTTLPLDAVFTVAALA
ncbi:hypothetical protein PMA3_20630 [Pseudomonas silesiensis]|uniref:Uncharacterized protein n=1 Tax=Pseudomonas silesiensis TaxID=1853130 RepID=A0A191YXD6_9PSED|nr:hypothetical protein [Pseudomonas silesiensis]ANJ57433.1 hypothetical protein PMA3_20630 [Pseudomonas silesiensis]